uniref:Small ribosomal subunit protein uS19c n=1 Tax=Jakoba libera TaxID=143017 RepID=M4QA27_JAKLI|nr:ribosomal protein S19 [Jakoba libera]AGH24211.1 ribosomal protein S19 [Jakoba libera]
MARSIWKGPFVDPKLLAAVLETKEKSSLKPIKTTSRNSIVLPTFVGFKFMIYNGKTWIPLTINEEMIGHKLGEFSKTRKLPKHKVKTSKPAVKK